MLGEDHIEGMVEIHYKGTLSKDDLDHLFSQIISNTDSGTLPGSIFKAAIRRVTVGISLITIIALLLYSTEKLTLSPILIFITVVLIVLLGVRFIRSLKENATRNGLKQLQVYQHGTITHHGILINSALGSLDVPWSKYISFTMDERFIILLKARGVTDIFSRGMFMDERDWENFQSIVRKFVQSEKANLRNLAKI